MSRLREDPLALAQWSNEVARATRIPLEHVVKDFWITESLRAMASRASEQSVLLVFKGGTVAAALRGQLAALRERLAAS